MMRDYPKHDEEADEAASKKLAVKEDVSAPAEVNEHESEVATSDATDNPVPLRRPLNSDYAGETYHFDGEKNRELFDKRPELEEKLERRIEKQPEEYRQLAAECPEGVRFDKDGYPDFSPYKYEDLEAGQKNEVSVEVTGRRGKDEALTNKAAGFEKTPDGYTWHHHQDGSTMQLVRKDVHEAVRHTGGVSTKSDTEIKKFVFDMLRYT
jgi:YHS domain-containing protein